MTTKFKNYKYPDGTPCKALTMTVKFALTIEEMATQFTARHTIESIEKAESMTKKQIISAIKYQLYSDGEERADYVVSDNDLEDKREAVIEIFKQRFNEG